MCGQDLTCRELVEIITDYLEGAMPEPERARFEEHVAGCAPCRAYLRQMRMTLDTVGRLREEDMAPADRAGLLTAFRQWHAGDQR